MLAFASATIIPDFSVPFPSVKLHGVSLSTHLVIHLPDLLIQTQIAGETIHCSFPLLFDFLAAPLRWGYGSTYPLTHFDVFQMFS